ncbi:hypothetical protein PIB30_022150 [Stylosanthes scabra]|uniref:Myb/SANT-like domain-containing protein n=1 Tax=Stylosanthes scabra TaxID=79078 RepID=A0ABU6U9J4_9FABA|nr:hypothetical protein [Stylosanthes scabra]
MASTTRQWTEQETAQFVVFMEELVVEGKRADASQFKPGAFQRLADKMNEKFPGCGLTGRNVTIYTPSKPFPLFEQLEKLFDKDRATGLEACSGKDAEKDVAQGSTFVEADGLGLGGVDVDMEDIAAGQSEFSNTFSTSFASSRERNQARQSASRKTNDATILLNLAETIKSAVEDQGKHVQVLANATSSLNDQVNLGRTLKELGLSTTEILQVARKFVQNLELKATFWSLDEEKAEFARDIMENF